MRCGGDWERINSSTRRAVQPVFSIVVALCVALSALTEGKRAILGISAVWSLDGGAMVKKEENNDQVDCCCWLCRSRRNFGTSDNAGADFSVERRHHASSLRMRPR